MLAIRSVIRNNAGKTLLSRSCFINTNVSGQDHPADDRKTLVKYLNTLSAQPAALINGQSSQWRGYSTSASTNGKVDISKLQRIYYGSLTPRMRAVKVFSLTTSLVGLAAQPMLLEQGMKLGGTGMAVFICGFAGIFTFVTPLLLHFVTKKYVTEIHFNPATQEYTATTISLILQKIQTTFRPKDVKVPEVPGMFTSFTVDKRSLFVDPALFEDPEHYVRIMGYDKPVDFKLDLKEDTNIGNNIKEKELK